jgi:hypothetical protein
MGLDLYSYGRAVRSHPATLRANEQLLEAFVCAGCGCSATAPDAALVLTIGWRLLPRKARGYERPALCPRCARRFVSGLI